MAQADRWIVSVAVVATLFGAGCTGADHEATTATPSPSPTTEIASTSQPSPTPLLPIDASNLTGDCASAAVAINRAVDEAGAYEVETPGGSPATQESSHDLNLALADIDAAGQKVRQCRSDDVDEAYALADARIYLIFNTDFGIDAGDLAKVGRDLDLLRARGFDRTHPDDFATLRSELNADTAKLRGK